MIMTMIAIIRFRYHTLHHREQETNLCLFMPIFDSLGGTLNPKSWEEHERICKGVQISHFNHALRDTLAKGSYATAPLV